MSDFIQLNPPLPVIVTSRKNESGQAIMVNSLSTEQNALWCVIMDKTSEIWWVPNPEIRAQKNWTMGRR